jgi:hypothetical protein
LRGYVVRIVEHMQCGVEADAMLTPVEPFLPRVPSELPRRLTYLRCCIYAIRSGAGVQDGF